MLPRLEFGVHQHIPDRGVEDMVARAARQADQALLARRAVRAAAAQHDRGHQEAVAQRRFQLPWLPGRPADLRQGSMCQVQSVLRDHAGTLLDPQAWAPASAIELMPVNCCAASSPTPPSCLAGQPTCDKVPCVSVHCVLCTHSSPTMCAQWWNSENTRRWFSNTVYSYPGCRFGHRTCDKVAKVRKMIAFLYQKGGGRDFLSSSFCCCAVTHTLP